MLKMIKKFFNFAMCITQYKSNKYYFNYDSMYSKLKYFLKGNFFVELQVIKKIYFNIFFIIF